MTTGLFLTPATYGIVAIRDGTSNTIAMGAGGAGDTTWSYPWRGRSARPQVHRPRSPARTTARRSPWRRSPASAACRPGDNAIKAYSGRGDPRGQRPGEDGAGRLLGYLMPTTIVTPTPTPTSAACSAYTGPTR